MSFSEQQDNSSAQPGKPTLYKLTLSDKSSARPAVVLPPPSRPKKEQKPQPSRPPVSPAPGASSSKPAVHQQSKVQNSNKKSGGGHQPKQPKGGVQKGGAVPPGGSGKKAQPLQTLQPQPNRPANNSSGSTTGGAAAASAATAPASKFSLLSRGGSALPRRITVEADYHMEDGRVGVRFYNQAGTLATALRSLMTLASVRNAAEDAHREERLRQYTWSDSDVAFLNFIRPALLKMNVKRLAANVYMVSAADFMTWRRTFAGHIGRFINRDDQKPLPPPGQSAPVGLAFQLAQLPESPEHFRLLAQLIFPEGKRKYVHDVLHEVEDRATGGVNREELFETELPVSWARLRKYFSSEVTTIRKEKVLELLPLLLNQHLELLESGPWVIWHNSNAANKAAAAAQSQKKPVNKGKKGKESNDNQDRSAEEVEPRVIFGLDSLASSFVIQAKLGQQPLAVNSNLRNLIKKFMINKRGQLVIEVGEASAKTAKAVAYLQELTRHGNAITEEYAVRFPNNADSATFLEAAWRAVPGGPEGIKKETTPELQTLFTPVGTAPITLQPQLRIHDQETLVSFGVEWTTGDSNNMVSTNDFVDALNNNAAVIKSNTGSWLAFDAEAARAIQRQLIDEGILESNGTGATLLRSEARNALRTHAASLKNNRIPTTDNESQFFAHKLVTEAIPETPPLPQHLQEILRDYQKTGVDFLLNRAQCNVGAILADDMGLGKTLQVLAMLETWRASGLAGGKGLPSLIVCPATVIVVWLKQAKNFCPKLPIVALTGNAETRRTIFQQNPKAVLVTHYGLVRADFEMLQSRNYEFVILDEAQNIKNPEAQATLAVKGLQTNHRLAITGTPLENRLTDLWSIMDFLNHGYLGKLEDFALRYNAFDNLTPLVRKLAPLMLRRDKTTVAAELPPRTVNMRTIEMTPQQRELYERELVLARGAVKESGAMEILAALTRLRQICCDPELVLKDHHDFGSGKLEHLLEQLAELTAAGHSVLVFSQFTQMLDVIQREMNNRNLSNRMITGSTPVEERQQIVDQFNADANPSTMLLSLKAAGTGLTLTKADYVFLYDPWWNPAAENQAIDRTHRIGQNRPVFAYRLIAENTIEERVMALMEAKQQLFDTVVGGASEEAFIAKLDRAELLQLLE